MKGGLLDPSSSVNWDSVTFKSQENAWNKDRLGGLLQSEWDRDSEPTPDASLMAEHQLPRHLTPFSHTHKTTISTQPDSNSPERLYAFGCYSTVFLNYRGGGN